MKRISMAILAGGSSLILAVGAMAQSQMGGQQPQSSPPPAQQNQPDPSNQPQQQPQQQMQAQPQQQQQQAQVQRQDHYPQQIMEPDKFKDLKVQDYQGEEVGTVDQLVLDAKEGRIGFIVVKTGGMFGMGGDTVIIPWSAVEFRMPGGEQRSQQGEQKRQQEGDPVLVVNAPKDRLMSAPQGEVSELDRKYAELIHQFYGVAPYWEESQGGQVPQGQPSMGAPGGQSMQQQPIQQQPMQQQPAQQMN